VFVQKEDAFGPYSGMDPEVAIAPENGSRINTLGVALYMASFMARVTVSILGPPKKGLLWPTIFFFSHGSQIVEDEEPAMGCG
jgi:hypothetical protein